MENFSRGIIGRMVQILTTNPISREDNHESTDFAEAVSFGIRFCHKIAKEYAHVVIEFDALLAKKFV